MHGMCQIFANSMQKSLLPPSDSANLLQNEWKSQPELLEITLAANLFSSAPVVVTDCEDCTKYKHNAHKKCTCRINEHSSSAQNRAALLL
jgi:hypothetical protein